MGASLPVASSTIGWRARVSHTGHPPPAGPARLPIHLPVPWAYVLVYLLGIPLGWRWPIHLSLYDRAGVPFAGVGIFALGAAIAGWGWIIFRKAGTTRVPGRLSSQLVTWGPYRFTRNPMYLGMAIAYVGEALIQKHVWPLLLLPLVIAFVNWVVIPVEQENMRAAFGEQYIEYQRRVRRWF